ncbi:TPA: leucyl aminopeptidase [Candidatus Woesearchaeota archaeon]|nr:leucyl aminopeptidase [Candidatus Woesearchaeota archaeon]
MAINIIVSGKSILETDAEAVYVGFFQTDEKDLKELKEFAKNVSKCIPSQVIAKVKELIAAKKFEGKKKQIYPVYLSDKKLVVAVGLGKKEEYNSYVFRQVVSCVSKNARDRKVKSYAFFLDNNWVRMNFEATAQAFGESTLLSLYKFDKLKTKDKNGNGSGNGILQTAELLIEDKKNIDPGKKAILVAQQIAECINHARDLINLPPNIATPKYIANEAKELVKKYKLKFTVLGRKEIEKNNLNLIKAVSSGSNEEAQFVILEYNGSNKAPICLVGKGITYDSGGLNLKPYVGSSASMRNMKSDMAGAASMIAVIEIAARLRLSAHIIALMPLCENMPDGKSYRCDDVIKAYNGINVEITNTDAEGRLVLADALAYAQKYKPACLIDAATLTGAASVAVGYMGACVMGSKEIVEKLKFASKDTDERIWELPLWEEYAELLDSKIGDLKNSNESSGPGTIMGGIFLKNFVEKTPWAHIDIAATATTEKDVHYTESGATGFGIRLLVEFVKKYR